MKIQSLRKKYLASIYGNILSIARECIPYFKVWHEGTFDASSITSDYEDLYLRNEHWLKHADIKDISGTTYKGLLDLIQHTNHSSCIAVGLAHCLSKDSNSLLHVFQEKGYIIEKLEPNIPKVDEMSFPKPCRPKIGHF